MKKLRNANSKVKGGVTAVSSAVMTAMMTVSTAMATSGGAISTQIKGGLKQVYDIITAIVLPIAAIVGAICAIKMIWGDDRSAEAAKKTLIRVVIGIAIVYLAPFLVEQVSSWFSGSSSSIW